MTHPRALVTGGAGFIGSHIVDGLLSQGYDVLVYDNLSPQVHGPSAQKPSYLDNRASFVQADVRDRAKLVEAVQWADVVLHEASAVGVGQSMYDIVSYVDVNCLGTATLCEILAKETHHVKKVLVASSMSNYGEGSYLCPTHGLLAPGLRGRTQLEARDWELRCPQCNASLASVGTAESKALLPASVYATTKRDQEELVLNVCRAYGIPAVAFRYFNIYGPRQALSNPYTGVAAIFSSRILNNQAPVLFEDGLQSRDFTHVSDVVQANLLALASDKADGDVLNVGTGVRTPLIALTNLLIEHLGKKETVVPEVVGKFREGDIRHCYADISAIREKLGFSPKVFLEQGVEDLVTWAREQQPADRSAEAMKELAQHKLVI